MLPVTHAGDLPNLVDAPAPCCLRRHVATRTREVHNVSGLSDRFADEAPGHGPIHQLVGLLLKLVSLGVLLNQADCFLVSPPCV